MEKLLRITNTMFNIQFKNNYSLNDIKDFQNEGGAVLRSAHIGNFNKATLLLAQEKFPILLHEYLTGNAPIYEPAYIKTQDKKKLVSNNPNISQLHDVSFPQDIVIDEKHFQIPTQYHYHILKSKFPNVSLGSEIFLQQQSFVQKVLGILMNDFPSMFYKYQKKDGSVFDFSHTTNTGFIYGQNSHQKVIEYSRVVNEVIGNFRQTQNCIKNQDESPQGIIMNSLLYILLSTIVKVYKGRNGVQRFNHKQVSVIHFSGTQMIHYLSKNKKLAKENFELLNSMYQRLREEFQDILPVEINFHLISTDVLSLISSYREENHPILDNLLKNIAGMRVIDATKSKKQREYAMSVVNDVHTMSNKDIVEKIIDYRKNINVLASGTKKKVSQLEELC
ncbi:hypothetical protein CSB09_01630 [Candidatus Gracilibacteria bacterium]|nr:MAG: hypothetical protein CSB09_01630 [Candidatus Gracilibacteria bacterium]